MEKRIGNWGNYPEIKSNEIQFSQNQEAADEIKNHTVILARGNGRCYGDASLADTTLKTTKYDKILAFDIENGIFESQCGITLDKILEVIVPKGWFLPVTPGTKFITIGGALASDIHGKNHHLEGSFSKHVIDFDLMTGDGKTMTVSRENYADLFEATAGGMGLTGLICRIKFRLKAIETAYIKQTQIKAANLEEILDLFEQYNHYTNSIAWIDCLAKGKNFGRSILMLGEHAKEGELPERFRPEKLKPGKKPLLNIPFYFPGFVLNNFTIKLFNWLYYHKNIQKEQQSITHYEPFFYPLDAINNWNRMYGKRGFLQYQFVLPFGDGKEGLIKILHRISEKGLGSFLAILKVFGKQYSMISFPLEGYTLALDFPVTPDIYSFLDELDELVEAYKGRVYLSKDARMKAAFFHRTYPRLSEFKQVLMKYNPDQKFISIQAERLNIFEN